MRRGLSSQRHQPKAVAASIVTTAVAMRAARRVGPGRQRRRRLVTCQPLEIGAKLRGALIPEVTILLQALADDPIEPGRDRARGVWRAIQNGVEHDSGVAPLKGCAPVAIS